MTAVIKVYRMHMPILSTILVTHYPFLFQVQPSDGSSLIQCSQAPLSQSFSCSQVQVGSSGRYNTGANEALCLEILGEITFILLKLTPIFFRGEVIFCHFSILFFWQELCQCLTNSFMGSPSVSFF